MSEPSPKTTSDPLARRRGFSRIDPDFILPTHATYGDYMSWPEDVRAEIIDGVVYPKHVDEQGMAAAPLTDHQDVVGEMYARALAGLRGGPCRPFVAPFAVRLDDAATRTFEPDITVICDRSGLGDDATYGGTTIHAAPEVLAPRQFADVTFDLTEIFAVLER